MSRITPPVTKLSHAIRSLSSSSTRHALKPSDQPFHSSTHIPLHRPSAPPSHTIPLMQGFRTSAAAAPPPPTIQTMDFIAIPTPPAAPPANPFAALRVPLLPDNYAPDRSALPAEAPDAALPPPEIHVVAARPDVAAALGEAEPAAWKEEGRDLGLLRELWGGIVDDIFGSASKPKLAV